MSDLDNIILEAILGDRFPKGAPIPSFVEKVKQAFRNEGYRKVIIHDYNGLEDEEGTPLLSGKEWYNRFEKELYKPKEQEYEIGTFSDDEKKARFYRDGGTNFMYNCAIDAAKRASGIDTEGE